MSEDNLLINLSHPCTKSNSEWHGLAFKSPRDTNGCQYTVTFSKLQSKTENLTPFPFSDGHVHFFGGLCSASSF